MNGQLTLEEFKNKIAEARNAAGSKNIISSDIPAPEGFVDTIAQPETVVAAESAPVSEIEPTAEEIEPTVVEAINAEVKSLDEISEKSEVAKTSSAAVEKASEIVDPPVAKKKSAGSVIYGRLDGDGPKLRIAGIVSPELASIHAALERAVKTGNVKNVISDSVVFGGILSKNKSMTSIWEEGGMRYGVGTSLIVANSDGSRPRAFTVYHNRNVCNGKHALVPVDVGSYIVLCSVTAAADHTLVYKVSEISCGDKNDQAKIATQLVAYIGGDDDPDFYETTTDEDRKLITTDASFIKAAYTQATTELSTRPGYINDYSPTKFDSVDYWDAIADSEYRATLQKFDTLPAAYEAAGRYLADAVANHSREGNAVLITTIDIPEGHEDVVRVFISGSIYKPRVLKNGVLVEKGTSRGHRGFYARVILQGDDVFYYADKDAQHGVSVAKTLEILKMKTNADGVRLPMVTALRRMTD